MPKTLKQYYRYFLVKTGLFDEGAWKLALDKINTTDTFIVSYPKSGNTWLRFILGNLLQPQEQITSRNIDAFIPDLYSHYAIANQLQQPRFMKTHHAWFAYYPKSIYIYRDYRDVLNSYFHYQTALGEFKSSFDQYIRVVHQYNVFGTWRKHVLNALEFHRLYPDRILLLQYENLLKSPEVEIQRIQDFCGINSALSNEEIISRCSFAELQKTELQHGSAFRDKSQQLFFREGQSEQWRTHYTPEQLAYVEAENGDVLRHLGYPIHQIL
jgi:hypothetical protein